MKRKMSIISNGLILNPDGLYLNADKIAGFKGLEIRYTGDIRLSCSWCNKMHEIERTNNLKTGFILGADNKSKKIITFSINPDPNLRVMYANNLPSNGKLFGIKRYNKKKFSIISAKIVDQSETLHNVTMQTNSNHFRYNNAEWGSLTTGSKNWEDINNDDIPIIPKIGIKSAKNKTGWELLRYDITTNEPKLNKKKYKSSKASRKKMNKPISKKGGY